MSVDDDDRVDPPPSTRDYRYIAAALALVAVACFGYAAFSQRWLVKGDAIGFGLRECNDCRSTPCLVLANDDMVANWQADPLRGDVEYTSGAFSPTGMITFGLLFVAMAGLLGAAVLALAKQTPALPIAPSTIGLLGIALVLISGCVFVATKPGPAGFVGVGTSFWIFGAGALAGLAGASLLAKINRPKDPDLMADAMNPDDY